MLFKKNFFHINKKILYKNKIYNIEFFDFIKPGKGRPFIRAKLRNLINKKLINKTFKSFKDISKINLVSKEYIFIFVKNNNWCFLNVNNFSQIYLNQYILRDNSNWLLINHKYDILFWNKNPIDLVIPNFINLKVLNINLENKINTDKNTKYVLLSNKIVIKVPLFIQRNDLIKVDTRIKKYISKVNN